MGQHDVYLLDDEAPLSTISMNFLTSNETLLHFNMALKHNFLFIALIFQATQTF